MRDLIDEGIVVGAGSVNSDGGRPRAAVPGIAEKVRDGLGHGPTYGWESVPLGRLLRSGTSLPLHAPCRLP